MARKPRDTRAEYAARKARAAERGETVYSTRDKRARNLGYAGYSQRRKARRSGEGVTAVDRAQSVKRGRQQIQRAGDMTIVSTTRNGAGYGVMEAQIRNAAAGAQVSINAVVKDGAGNDHEITIFGRGGWSAKQLAAVIADDGLESFITDYGDDLYGFSGGVSAVVSAQVVIW